MRKTFLSILFVLVFTTGAIAVPITGDVSFGGSFLTDGYLAPDAPLDAVPDMSTATQISFLDAYVTRGTGTFADIPSLYGANFGLTYVSFNTLFFSPDLLVTNPFWLFDDFSDPNVPEYSFDLTSIRIVTQTSSFLNLSGEGILSATGYDDTPGRWTFTSTDGVIFTSNSTAPVPEPSTLLLLGSGLIGLAYLKRRKS